MSENTIVLTVPDMVCGSCENTIKATLSHISGIKLVNTDLDSSTVTITSDNSDIEEIISALSNVGFNADFKKKH